MHVVYVRINIFCVWSFAVLITDFFLQITQNSCASGTSKLLPTGRPPVSTWKHCVLLHELQTWTNPIRAGIYKRPPRLLMRIRRSHRMIRRLLLDHVINRTIRALSRSLVWHRTILQIHMQPCHIRLKVLCLRTRQVSWGH